MKITNNPNIQRMLGAYKKRIENVNSVGKLKQEKDKVEISENAREFQVAMNAYKNLSEIRKGKVEEVCKKLESGNYNPSAEEIVKSLFDKKI